MTASTSQSKAIEARGLTKSFSGSPVLRGIDLDINQGDSVVILGPNGAGKTTLIKVLATIMKPSSGELTITGLHYKKNDEEIRRKIGVVTHQTYFYGNLTAYDNLEFYSRMYGVPDFRERILEVVSMVGMTSRLYDRVGTFSRGMQQRMSIARALLHKPSIMLLDEPETGLDQDALSVLWTVVKGQDTEKRTIILTTHNLKRGLELGDRLVILCNGKITHEQSCEGLDLAGLKQTYQEYTKVKK